MKTLLIRKDATPEDIVRMNEGIAIIKERLASIGILMDFTFLDSTETFVGEAGSLYYHARPREIVEIAFKNPGYDLYCLMFNQDSVTPRHPDPLFSPFNPAQYPYKLGNGTVISMPIQWYGLFSEVFAQFFIHEFCHAQYFLNGKSAQDQTHHKANYGQFSQSSETDFYLFLLAGLVPPLTLKKGSKGLVVTALQNALKSLGFYTAKVDGDFGGKTDTAVKNFQAKHGLKADGIVGKNTWSKINEEQKKKSI